MGLKDYFSNYPKCVFLILGNEFCERFSYYGMKAILTIYLSRALGNSDDDATAIYHGFNMACYFTPIFGAALADGYLGKYKTILSLSILYSLGNIVQATSAVPFTGSGYHAWLCFLGLGLIAIGTGGIKPCVGAFGADQFNESQTKQKDQFFSMFYMAINLGSFLSMIITPLIRSNISCFGDDCYSFAFAIPAFLMIVAVVFFAAGTKQYTITPPGNNILGRSIGCISVAISGVIKSCKKTDKPYREHWLYHAEHKYDAKFIEDVRCVLAVCFMFITFPIYWALYDQQGSRWVLQAGEMNGDIGIANFRLEPDIMSVLNPICVLILVPFCEYVIFPCFDKLHIPNKPLQRIPVGMLLAALSFLATGLLQMTINNSQPKPVGDGLSNIQIINSSPCEIIANVSGDTNEYIIPFKGHSETVYIQYGLHDLTIDATSCKGIDGVKKSVKKTFEFCEKYGYNLLVTYSDKDNLNLNVFEQTQMVRTTKGRANITFYNTLSSNIQVDIKGEGEDMEANQIVKSLGNNESISIRPYDYKISYRTMDDITSNYTDVGSIRGDAGALTSIIIQKSMNDDIIAVLHEDISPNSVNILLQLPQYIIMALSEVFFIISGMAFAYSQAPDTMKAVLQAANLLTTSFGNLIVLIIAKTSRLEIVTEFFVFAGLMVITMVIYLFMAKRYKYIEEGIIDEYDDIDDDGKTEMNDSTYLAFHNPSFTEEKTPEIRPRVFSQDEVTEF